MKAVILAGGLGTRLSEETSVRPKPMVEIGGKPILWHIMNTYAHHGVNEFIIALGYMSEFVKEYFLNFYAKNNDITIDLSSGKTEIHHGRQPNWIVHLVDTGLNTQTGGRVKRIKKWLGNDQTFMLTYGDGVADVNIKALLEFHQNHGKYATMTAVRPPSRFGEVMLQGNQINSFTEKPQTGEGWINGGYFVLEREILEYIAGDNTYWERDPLEKLAEEQQLMAFQHAGFWQPMDTLREKRILEDLWQSGQAPWKVWS
jgi:glucose-1-phosphate cytidylyltransferase